MTYRSPELAERAQREQLERQVRDLEHERDELLEKSNRLTASLDEQRTLARASLRHYPKRDRWIALAWLVSTYMLLFIAGTLPRPYSLIVFFTCILAMVGAMFLARRKAGSEKEREAADKALREQLVEIARARVRNSTPPDEREEEELEEEEPVDADAARSASPS